MMMTETGGSELPLCQLSPTSQERCGLLGALAGDFAPQAEYAEPRQPLRDAEAVALRHLGAEDRGLQHSAIRIVKRVGSADSVPALRAQLDGADDETKLLLQDVIGSLSGGA